MNYLRNFFTFSADLPLQRYVIIIIFAVARNIFHIILLNLTSQSYTIKTAIPSFYCIISPHQSQLDIIKTVRPVSRNR